MMNWTEKTSALNVAISLFVEHLTAKVALFADSAETPHYLNLLFCTPEQNRTAI